MTTITNPTMDQLEAIAAQVNNSKSVVAEAPPVEEKKPVDDKEPEMKPVTWPTGFTVRELLQKHLVDLYENYDLTTTESSGWKYNGEIAKAAIKAGWFNEPVSPEFVDNMKPINVRRLAEAILTTLRNTAISPN